MQSCGSARTNARRYAARAPSAYFLKAVDDPSQSRDRDRRADPFPGGPALRSVGSEAVRLAVEISTDCIKVLSLEGNLEYMNEGGMCVMEIDDFGHFRGACWPDFWQGEESAKANAALDEARAGGVGRLQGYTATAKGNVRYWDVTVSPIPGPDGRPERLLSVSRDITSQREAEVERERLAAELEAERQKLRTLFEQAPAIFSVVTGPDLRFDYVNEGHRQITGHRPMLGLTVAEAMPEVAGGGEGQDYDRVFRRVYETGERLAFYARPVAFQNSPGAQAEPRFLDLSLQPLRDGEGTITGVLAHGVDVTDQVRARDELASMNERLEASVTDRTAELRKAVQEAEGFNYSISHDLRTPLRAMASTSGILLEELGPDLSDAHRELLLRQAHNAGRMGRLIDDLLRLSRLSRAEVRRETVDMTTMARAVAATAGCECEVQEGMVAEADPGLVRTVLQNLVENAAKFSGPGCTVRIGQTEGTFWVEDQGVGFEMRFAEKVFLPFERLVAEHEFPGTGIGLANVKRIVERHGGRVWCESSPGRGSTFFFTLSSLSEETV